MGPEAPQSCSASVWHAVKWNPVLVFEYPMFEVACVTCIILTEVIGHHLLS